MTGEDWHPSVRAFPRRVFEADDMGVDSPGKGAAR